MRRLLRVLIILGVLLWLDLPGAAGVQAQGTRVAGCRYFPTTGHNVQSEFLAFFDRLGGDVIFGQPLTEELVQDGFTVQYFQRVRMELHPQNPPRYRVQLSLLGDLLGYRQPPIPAANLPAFDNPQRRYYPQTGHTLSYGFLQYYDTHGGLDVFGYPITEMLPEGSCVVQYFQRGKMEWHPENPISSQVTLGSLGNEYIAYRGLAPQYLAPVSSVCASGSVAPAVVPTAAPAPSPQPTPGYVPPTPVPVPQPTDWYSVPTAVPVPSPPPQQEPTAAPTPQPRPTDFAVSASVKYPTTGQGGPQTVYVRVTDSWGQGVRDASVEATVHFRSGDQVVRGITDASGSSSLTFSIEHAPPGYMVMIEVRVTYAGRTVIANTSFTVWS